MASGCPGCCGFVCGDALCRTCISALRRLADELSLLATFLNEADLSEVDDLWQLMSAYVC